MKIFTNKDKTILLEQAGDKISKYFIQNKAVPILFLSSGGSCLSILEFINHNTLNSNISISVLDERFDTNPDINNFLQLRQTKFYQTALKKNCKFLETIPYSQESLEAFADRLGKQLIDWITLNPVGKIIATFGIGADGHTSGILPFPEDENLFSKQFCSHSLIRGYNAENKSVFKLRATTTITFLTNYIDKAIFFVSGVDKISALKNALSNNFKLHEVPSSLINSINECDLFTDIELYN